LTKGDSDSRRLNGYARANEAGFSLLLEIRSELLEAPDHPSSRAPSCNRSPRLRPQLTLVPGSAQRARRRRKPVTFRNALFSSSRDRAPATIERRNRRLMPSSVGEI